MAAKRTRSRAAATDEVHNSEVLYPEPKKAKLSAPLTQSDLVCVQQSFLSEGCEMGLSFVNLNCKPTQRTLPVLMNPTLYESVFSGFVREYNSRASRNGDRAIGRAKVKTVLVPAKGGEFAERDKKEQSSEEDSEDEMRDAAKKRVLRKKSRSSETKYRCEITVPFRGKSDAEWFAKETVLSRDSREGKKRVEARAYELLCLKHIPLDTLRSLMIPFAKPNSIVLARRPSDPELEEVSFDSKGDTTDIEGVLDCLSQPFEMGFAVSSGDCLCSGISRRIKIHPMPLDVCEMNVFTLFKRVKSDENKEVRKQLKQLEKAGQTDEMERVQSLLFDFSAFHFRGMAFVRDDPVALTQAILVELVSERLAIAYARLIDDRLFKGHRMIVTFEKLDTRTENNVPSDWSVAPLPAGKAAISARSDESTETRAARKSLKKQSRKERLEAKKAKLAALEAEINLSAEERSERRLRDEMEQASKAEKMADFEQRFVDFNWDSIEDRSSSAENSKHLMLCGFPCAAGMNEAKVRHFLESLGISCRLSIALRHRYSIVPYACIRFPLRSLACDALALLNQSSLQINNSDDSLRSAFYLSKTTLGGGSKRITTKSPIFARFAQLSEFLFCQRKSSVKSLFDSVSRSSDKVLIKNLPWNVTESDLVSFLESEMKRDGQSEAPILKAEVIYDKHLAESQALVEFVSEDLASFAVRKLNGKRFSANTQSSDGQSNLSVGSNMISIELHLKQTREDKKTLRMLENMRREELAEERRSLREVQIRKRKRVNQKRRVREAVKRIQKNK